MAFENLNGRINLPKVGGGEIQGRVIKIGTTNFENTNSSTKVLSGRFASVNSDGKLTKGKATGNTVAGVVMREITNSMEVSVDGEFDASTNHINYVRSGLITVDASTNEAAPSPFSKVKVKDSDGTATVTGTTGTSETNAEFIQEVKPQVWLIRLI